MIAFHRNTNTPRTYHNATAIVLYLQQLQSAVFALDLNVGRLGVECILQQLLERIRWSLNNLLGCREGWGGGWVGEM